MFHLSPTPPQKNLNLETDLTSLFTLANVVFALSKFLQYFTVKFSFFQNVGPQICHRRYVEGNLCENTMNTYMTNH